MVPSQSAPAMAGYFRLFQLAGITVYLHWSWLLVAFFEIQAGVGVYGSRAWKVVEYASLFAIVLLHEFGHALACRQVGGQANQIVLWPLGGIAYVRPPARPGAVLWSIAAGPLVNVLLVPLTFGAVQLAAAWEWDFTNPDAYEFLRMIRWINLSLLIFNLLPIYPLDGGQILQALLWFPLGRARSLFVASFIGVIGGVGLIGLAVLKGNLWLGIVAAFVALRCWVGFRQARLLAELARAPRHPEAACPSCGAHPLQGDIWVCNQCGTHFDTFAHRAVCPACSKLFHETECIDCLRSHPIADWFGAAATTPKEVQPEIDPA